VDKKKRSNFLESASRVAGEGWRLWRHVASLRSSHNHPGTNENKDAPDKLGHFVLVAGEGSRLHPFGIPAGRRSEKASELRSSRNHPITI